MPLIDPSVPLTLADTLGSVVASVVDAQQQSARATVDFINDLAFGPDGPNPDRDVVTVSFSVTKLDENRQPVPFVLEVPLLSLVDIPLIAVRKATFAFSYDVTETRESAREQPAAGAERSSIFNAAKVAVLKGRLAKRTAGATPTDPVRREERASIDVFVELEKAALPAGLDRLIDALENAAGERRPNGGP